MLILAILLLIYIPTLLVWNNILKRIENVPVYFDLLTFIPIVNTILIFIIFIKAD